MNQPWASGPAEILKHGLELLSHDSDTNRRLALISIDNAVELMIKTFLSLPRRVTGLTFSRKDYAEIAESFPRLLDALEQHAADKLTGINLGEIEWYHRLRNELYHQGNGLTVERDKIEVYAELAKLLFNNLYGLDLLPERKRPAQSLGEFMKDWVVLEQRLYALASARGITHLPDALVQGIIQLRDDGTLTDVDAQHFEGLRRLRNQLVHGQVEVRAVLDDSVMRQLRALLKKVPAPPSAT